MGTEAIAPWSKTSLLSDTQDHPAAHSMTEKMRMAEAFPMGK
jgi:hypothetical protein